MHIHSLTSAQSQGHSNPFDKLALPLIGHIGGFLSLKGRSYYLRSSKRCHMSAKYTLLENDAAIQQILRKARGKISAIPEPLRSHVKEIAQSIKSLDLSYLETTTSPDFLEFVSHFTNLVALNIIQCEIPLTAFKLDTLVKLEIYDIDTEEGFKQLIPLQDLTISGKVYDGGKKLSLLQNLVKLDLHATAINLQLPDAFKELASLRQLKELALSDDVDEAALSYIATMENLVKLELTFTATPGASQKKFQKLAALKNLQSLALINLSHDTLHDTALIAVFALKGLKHLILQGKLLYSSLMHEKEFKKLTCQNLESLELINTNMNEFGLKKIATMKGLKQLSLEACNEIEPEGFKELVSLQNLESLVLSRTKINDNAVLHIITNMKSLRALDISYCENITKEGFEQISSLESLPKPVPLEINCEGTAFDDDTDDDDEIILSL